MKSRQQRLKRKSAYIESAREVTNIICTMFGKPSLVKGLEEERKVYPRIRDINNAAKERRRKKFVHG